MIGSLWFNSFSAGGGAAGDYELISTTVLGSATSSVTFSGLGTSAAAYKHLQLRITAQSTFSSGSARAGINVTFNSDTANNYSWHGLFGDGSTVGSQASTTTSSLVIADIPFLASSNSVFGAIVADILDFSSTSKNKTVRSLGGHSGSGATNHIDLSSGAWYSTSAVTSITLKPITYNFITGSRFSLYGLKA